MDEAHESGDAFLASQGDASEAFEFVEEAFDLMPLFIEAPVNGRAMARLGLALICAVAPRSSAMKVRRVYVLEEATVAAPNHRQPRGLEPSDRAGGLASLGVIERAFRSPDRLAHDLARQPKITRNRLASDILPKTEKGAALEELARLFRLIALLETARGVADARAIAASKCVARFAFGSFDYAADLGCAHDHGALASARSEIVFSSRLGGLPAPLDGGSANIVDPDVTAADARTAYAWGFGGKMAIHPRQVSIVQAGFCPSPQEVDWARRVLSTGDGATAIDGAMVD